MKLAEKLKAMSVEQAMKEDAVINEIVTFFAEKFENGEMMEAFEKGLSKEDVCKRKKNISLDFWTYIPGCSETYVGFLGKKWKPEDKYNYEYKGVNLKNIYKDVLAGIIEIARESFEEEGFKVNVRPNDDDRRFETYIIEISW